jgi:hypothetical protein
MRIHIPTKPEKEMLAISASISPLQAEYRKFLNEKCKNTGRSHPFEGSPEDVSDFMLSISDEWAEHKAKLGLA